jgi:hypothetical protein
MFRIQKKKKREREKEVSKQTEREACELRGQQGLVEWLKW